MWGVNVVSICELMLNRQASHFPLLWIEEDSKSGLMFSNFMGCKRLLHNLLYFMINSFKQHLNVHKIDSEIIRTLESSRWRDTKVKKAMIRKWRNQK